MGIYRVSTSEWYVIAQKWTGTNWSLGYMLSGDPSSFVQIKLLSGDNNKVTGYAQVQDMAYFSVGTAATIQGFKWRKSDSTLADFTITGAGTVKGDILIAYKSRLWIAGTGDAATGSRVMFSTIDSSGSPKLDTWTTATDFFDVAPGEGGFITAMLPLNNSILIFKNDGTWRFSYPGSPSKGQQDKVSGYIGAANQYCVVDFENYVYVYSQGRVYELINNIYNQINRTVKFNLDPNGVDSVAPDVSLSVVTRRLVFRYYNTIYSYFIDTKSWSQWRSTVGTPGRFYQLPADTSSANQSTYIAAGAGSTLTAGGNTPDILITICDKYEATPVETITCTMRTKSYDYQTPSSFKRLFWWGADVKTTRSVAAKAIPIAKQLPISWGQLSAYTHTQLSAGTWGSPLSFLNTSLTILDTADVTNALTDNGRLFIKILKSLRFRQIAYELTLTTTGDVATGPCKVFSITSYVLPKENAVAKVS
jgi:hypothetical protein